MDTSKNISAEKIVQYLKRFLHFTKPHVVFPIVLMSSLFTVLLANGKFPPMGIFSAYCIVLVFAYIGASAIDDYFDYRSDVINNIPRPLVTGEVSPKEAFTWGNGAIVIATIIFFLLFGLKGLMLSVFITTYLYLFCYLGNRGRLPLITQVLTVTATNLISVILPWFIFSVPNTWMLFLYVAGVIWDFCHDCSTAILHIKGDFAAGQRTAAVDLGPKGAAKLALILRPIWICMGLIIASRFMGIVAYLIMLPAMALGFFASTRLLQNPTEERARFAYVIHTVEFNIITLGFVIDTLIMHQVSIHTLLGL